MADLSDDELHRAFLRRRRFNAYGFGLAFLSIPVAFSIAWTVVGRQGSLTYLAFALCAPFVVAYLIAKSVYWRCPACGRAFSWNRRRLAEYYRKGASCAGCKRIFVP